MKKAEIAAVIIGIITLIDLCIVIQTSKVAPKATQELMSERVAVQQPTNVDASSTDTIISSNIVEYYSPVQGQIKHQAVCIRTKDNGTLIIDLPENIKIDASIKSLIGSKLVHTGNTAEKIIQ